MSRKMKSRTPRVAGITVDGRTIYRVYHDRENTTLCYWFTFDPESVDPRIDIRLSEQHFDIRHCRELVVLNAVDRAMNRTEIRSLRKAAFRGVKAVSVGGSFAGSTGWRHPQDAKAVAVRWDQNRMERRTASALAPSRRSARL